MKKYYKVFVLSIMALVCASLMFAQSSTSEEQLTAEQIRELIRIKKQEIRETSKTFLVDDLPELIAADPARADQALQGFTGILKLLSDNEVMYLLGHMYARIGEDERAITIFDSLLDTDMNEGARKMLNMVLYRKLTKYLDAGDHNSAKDFLRLLVFENYNTEKYFPTYLYIYTDLNASDGSFKEVAALIQSYNSNRDVVLTKILPTKLAVLQRLDKMDFTPYLNNPNQANFNKLNAEIDQTKADLTGLYSFVMGMKGMIFVDALVRLHEQEMGQLDLLKKHLADYANTTVRTEEQMKLPLSYIEGARAALSNMDRILQLFDVYSRRNYERLANEAAKNTPAFKGDLQLDKIITNDKTLEIYRETLAEINRLLASGDYPQHTSRLLSDKKDLEQKIAEAELRNNIYITGLEHSSSDEEKLFTDLLREYESYAKTRREMKLTVDEMEQLIRTEVRTSINEDLRDAIRPRIFNTVALVKQSSERDRIFSSGFGEILPNIEFVTLQLSYRELMSQRQQFEKIEMTLADGERQTKRAELRAMMKDMISNINTFLSANPSFTAIEQPGGGNLAGTADLYYNLGELQYEADPDDMLSALNSFRTALQMDPNLPDKDLALYNVAFLSSEIKRADIERNSNAFFSSTRSSENRPANTLYRESEFAESLNSYKEIVKNHPNSKLYEESVYRLGLLNFAFAEDATDSESTDRFRALALGYFDELANKPESPLHYDAIYQRGWVKLNVMSDSVLRSAMADFMTLLKAVEANKISDPDVARDYKDDAIKNLAYCLIALDGTDFSATSKGIAEIRNLFEGYSDSDVISRVVTQATSYKRDLGTSLQAIDFMRLTIDMAPLALENPTILDSILTLYSRSAGRLREGESFDSIRQGIYQELITNYNHKSQWYEANKNKAIQEQLAKVENAYNAKGIRLFNNFVGQSTKENLLAFKTHRDDFADYKTFMQQDTATFVAESDSVVTRFYVEIADNASNEIAYMEAVDQLYRYNEKYPQHSSYFDNELRALGYAQNVFFRSQEKFAQAGYTPEPGMPASLDEAFAYFSTSAMRFIDVTNNEKFRTPENQQQAQGLVLSLADIQNERGKKAEATALYLKALENENLMENPTKRDVFVKLAMIEGEANRYNQSEQWYRRALPLAFDNADRQNITTNIMVQIQSSFEAAKASNNYTLEATERLRLAQEFGPNDASQVLGQKIAAQEAFVKAREYQRAIDLLMEIAQSDREIDAIYARYDRAIVIAESDSLMNNKALAATLEQEFIDKHPSSNQAFRLRMARLVKALDDPARYTETAETYLTLHTEAKNGTINIGNTSASDLFELGMQQYKKANNKEKYFELCQQFMNLYPNHENVVPYMVELVEGNRGKENYETLAKSLFKMDKTKSAYYQELAEKKLQDALTAFNTAYANLDYAASFVARDEFKRIEDSYKKEGLTFKTENTYAFFAGVQKEYDNIQKRLAYLKSYDAQLSAIDASGYFSKTPGQHITMNNNTGWDKNLQGKGKRFDAFDTVVKAEIAKVTKVIKQAGDSGYELDNPRKLKAMSLMAKIYDKAYSVIDVQVGRYFETTSEASWYRNNNTPEQLADLIFKAKLGVGNKYRTNSWNWSYQIYTQYYVAGYIDQYTEAAKKSLEDAGVLPDLKASDNPLDSSWTLTMLKGSSKPISSIITSPKGAKLGSLDVPPEETLTAKKTITGRISPDFAILQVMYPMDFGIIVNGSEITATWAPVDTLVVGKPATTRYAYYLDGSVFAEGDNLIELTFPNAGTAKQQMAFNLQVFTDKERLRQTIPPVVANIYSNPGWKVITTNPETGAETKTFALSSPNWGIAWENIQDMAPNAAQGIWVAETDSTRMNSVIFEIDFMVDNTFIAGSIDLVAPESVSVLLNGNSIADNALFDYEPEPLAVYPSQIDIPAAQVVQGKNTLRFIVKNTSQYRGFLAAITYSIAGKEEIR